MEKVQGQDLPLRPARPPAALRRSTVAGVGMALVLITTLTGLSINQSRVRYEERGAVTTQNLALSLEQAVSGIIDKTDLSLRAAQLLAESQIARGGIDGKFLDAFLTRQKSLMPELEALRVTDATGVVRFGAGVPVAPAVSLGDRNYFARLRDDANAGLVIDGPVPSRFTDKWVTVFARRINQPDGAFGGMVYAVIAAEHFRRMFSTMDLGAHGAVSLRTDTLRLVARFPDTQQGGAVGSSNVSSQLSEIVRTSPRTGSYVAVTTLDNIERQNSYRKVANYPFYIIVGIATADYLGEWRDDATKILALAVLVILIMLMASLLVFRSWQRQLSVRDALAAESYRNRQFLRNASDGVHILDDRGNLLELSDSFAAMLGYSREELIGRNVRDWDAKWNDHELKSVVQRHLYGMSHAMFETRHRRRDGSIIDVEITAHPLELDGKTVLFNSSRDVTERKRANAEREHFAAIVANSNDAIVGRALDGTVISWNPAAERLFGYTAAEAIGRELTEIFTAGNAPEVTANREMISLGKAVPNYETVRIAKDGRRLNLSLSVFPLKDSDGIVIGMSSIVRDNSELKRAGEVHARLAAIVESSQDAIISRAPDGTILSWNGGAEQLFGYSAGEAIGRNMTLIIPPERREFFKRNQQLLLEGQVQPPYEGVNLTKDGHRIPVSISNSPVRAADGSISHVATVIRDITAAKKAEAQLRLAAGVFDTAAEGIIITDHDNLIVAVNAAFTRITGYAAQEVIGKNPRLLSSGRQAQKFYEEMWAAVRTSGSWQGEVWERRKNGELYCELLSISTIRNSAGEVVQHCAIFMDITLRKQAEDELRRLNDDLENRVAQRTRELERANRELDAFSYSVSHDLRAPLRAISGFSALTLKVDDQNVDPTTRDYLKKIQAGAERMGRLIDDLLRLSRISRQQMRRQDFDLSQMAREVVAVLREESPQRAARVTVAPNIRANGDRSLIRIVLDNLIGNAWKFTARNAEAKIDVGCVEQGGETAYYVRDNGAGFDMRYAGKLFNAFQRLHTSAEFEGTGIGLSVVQRIVSRHGGRVWAEGEAGAGATFYFTLGRPEHAASSAVVPSPGMVVH